MKIRTKTGALIISCMIAAASLAGCGTGSTPASTTAAGAGTAPAAAQDTKSDVKKAPGENTGDSKHISVVCTIFPEYDWVKQIMGDKAENAEISYLLENGVDLHNYQPTAEDIIRISNCDLFVYVGGESDEWAEEALEDPANKDMKVINLLETMGDSAKLEELKEGMQGHDHDHDHEDGDEDHDHEEGEEDHDHEDGDEDHDHEEGEGDHDHDHEHEEEYDEHVWLSLRNAKYLCAEITEDLSALDPANADTYKANFNAYSAELDKLDSDMKELVDAAPVKTVVFGDRFPFRYFVDDYGLDYYAAFVGCSAETEASFETIIFLAQKIDEVGCRTIYTIENSDKKIAETIKSSTQSKDQTVAELNSLQSISRADIDGGATYLSLMRRNYEVLKDTLK